MKKTNQWKQEQTRELQKQGIKVFSPANLNDIKIKERVCSYEDDYKKILKKLPKEPENYAVSFEDNYSGMPEKCIYCLNPKVRRPKQTVEQDEKAKNQNTMNKLQNKIAIFKREFLIRKSQELMQPGTKKTKAISLFALLQEGISWNDRARRETTEKLLKDEKIGKASFGSIEPNFSKILAMDEKNIDRIISYVSGLWIKQMGNHLTKAAETLGVNLTEHFIINEEYLKPYTKQALLKLATEIGLDKHLKQKGIDNWGKSKRPDMVNYFLNEGFDLKGKVPKLIQ